MAIQSFKNNPRFSPRTRRIVPSDVTLPDIQIPAYYSPCSDAASCKHWMCTSFFNGIVPDASKLANPQVNSRATFTSFTNSTSQSVNVNFANGGFDAYGNGGISSLNATAMIDDVNMWSSDDPDPLS